MFRKLKYNGSGCLDMTAYLAILNIEMENKRKQKKNKAVKHNEERSKKNYE